MKQLKSFAKIVSLFVINKKIYNFIINTFQFGKKCPDTYIYI